jgi:hypothetical protein
VDVNEGLAKIEQFRRDREALRGSVEDLLADLEKGAPTDHDEREQALYAIIARFVAYVQLEEEQIATLTELLTDAYEKLAKP